MSASTFDKELLRSRVADKLVAMEKMFDPRCKLTFVMRAPHLADGDMIVTSDHIDSVITALQRLRGYEEIRDPALPARTTETPSAPTDRQE